MWHLVDEGQETSESYFANEKIFSVILSDSALFCVHH